MARDDFGKIFVFNWYVTSLQIEAINYNFEFITRWVFYLFFSDNVLADIGGSCPNVLITVSFTKAIC